MALPAAAQAQAPAPMPAQVQTQTPPAAQTPVPRPRTRTALQSTVSVDGSEAMFTTICALLAAGFESNGSSDNWTAFRAQRRERLRQQQGPAVEAVREFYRQHELRDPGAMLSRYLWFGLVSGPAPAFQPVLRRDELPPEVIALEGFSEILSNYYQEQKIGQLWRQVQPIYNREVERLHDPVSQVVFVASGYLREILEPSRPRAFAIVVARLPKSETAELSMKLFFPDLVRSIDMGAEAKRLAAVKFAPAVTAKPEDEAASEEVARRRSAAPTTVPNDAEVITALTEGERRIAEKNPRAAEASFQKVLMKYPHQARAGYGLGLVALPHPHPPTPKHASDRPTPHAPPT